MGFNLSRFKQESEVLCDFSVEEGDSVLLVKVFTESGFRVLPDLEREASEQGLLKPGVALPGLALPGMPLRCLRLSKIEGLKRTIEDQLVVSGFSVKVENDNPN